MGKKKRPGEAKSWMLMPPGPQRWIGFGFRKLILIVEGKKDGLDEDQMKNRQVGREAPERFW